MKSLYTLVIGVKQLQIWKKIKEKQAGSRIASLSRKGNVLGNFINFILKLHFPCL